VAVNPSDTAPALVALDAQMVIQSASGVRVVNAEDYFIGPSVDITRMTVLAPNELLTAIRIPSTWAGARFYFEKVRDRNVWDFPLLNVASAVKYAGGNIENIRIVINAAAARPAATARGGERRHRQAQKRADGGSRRSDRYPGGAGAALQRLQDPVDAQPREAGHSR
jgi:xanthine dehydrogenase YagS FAD-binding subunit